MLNLKFIEIAISFLALIYAIIFHEIAHGYVALKLGDSTAKNRGRLTLNPIPHLDILGSILLPALLIVTGSPFIIGWAKPVPVSTIYFKNPIKDMMKVAIAGPLTNFSIALFCSFILKTILFLKIGINSPTGIILHYFTVFLVYSIQINVVLGIFNLLPIPPLDGSRVLLNFLPYHLQSKFMMFERYGFALLFILIYFGFFRIILSFIALPIIRFLL
ncbi:site-2 protease family protein [Candidatus Margulisiibacteriota bacterium]